MAFALQPSVIRELRKSKKSGAAFIRLMGEYEKYLLGVAAEECAETAVRLSKAQRFGLEDVQPGQKLDNEQRISQEVTDLLAVLDMLGIPYGNRKMKMAKWKKVLKFAKYSRSIGRL